MGSEASDQVMALLKELASLKEQDSRCGGNPSESEQEAHRVRQKRHDEITQNIKALAEFKKGE